MGKAYDLSKASDMRRFERDLADGVKDAARQAITQDGIDIDCPRCGSTMHAAEGPCRCPACGEVTDISFDWSEF